MGKGKSGNQTGGGNPNHGSNDQKGGKGNKNESKSNNNSNKNNNSKGGGGKKGKINVIPWITGYLQLEFFEKYFSGGKKWKRTIKFIFSLPVSNIHMKHYIL